MKIKILQELFCQKISLEVKCFKRRMLKKKPERIVESAYRIHCIISIYEALMERSQELDQETLELFLVIPDILTSFYEAWLNKPDSFLHELDECVSEGIRELKSFHGILEGIAT